MQLKPHQLSGQLKKGLATCYLVSGDEPLLVQEAADAIRQAAREGGYRERQRITIASKSDWLELGHLASALYLGTACHSPRLYIGTYRHTERLCVFKYAYSQCKEILIDQRSKTI